MTKLDDLKAIAKLSDLGKNTLQWNFLEVTVVVFP
jgi:hypothetical protein